MQLANKCHLALFAFVLFSDFFHSVKKVPKPRIFCEIICVLKKTLVILIRMLSCTAFFKGKKFVFYFHLYDLQVGRGFHGQEFHGGQFSRGQISGG